MSVSSEAGELEGRVLAALRQIALAPEGADVVSAGQVCEVVATGPAVRVLLDPERFDSEASQQALAEAVTPLVEAVPGVGRAVVKPRPRSAALRPALPGVGRVLGVHSGKGGVGKSTVTVNLALALAARGLRVGLLDADVYGPSVPTLLGMHGRLETTADGARVRPMAAHGLAVVSLGLLMPAGQALVWRGSLVDQGVAQLVTEVDWGTLDLLLVDLPPGTSDVHLALARQAAPAGVVTVTAPGQVSVDDVRRGMEMFADLAVPCLGLVENLAAVACRHCGTEAPLFGSGGAEALAAETGLPLLARIPFRPGLAEASDAGRPPVAEDPASPLAAPFHGLAAALAPHLSAKTPAQEA